MFFNLYQITSHYNFKDCVSMVLAKKDNHTEFEQKLKNYKMQFEKNNTNFA